MSVHLPSPIGLYVKVEIQAILKRCRTALRPTPLSAMKVTPMRDWPPSRNGRLRQKRNTTTPSAPLEVTHQDEKTVLKAKLTGNFPGSPVMLEFSFVLESGKIVYLEIH